MDRAGARRSPNRYHRTQCSALVLLIEHLYMISIPWGAVCQKVSWVGDLLCYELTLYWWFGQCPYENPCRRIWSYSHLLYPKQDTASGSPHLHGKPWSEPYDARLNGGPSAGPNGGLSARPNASEISVPLFLIYLYVRENLLFLLPFPSQVMFYIYICPYSEH